jgi:Zn finger protein HypA/HybF involved in hydrogenase expression
MTDYEKGYQYGFEDAKRRFERPKGKWIEVLTKDGSYCECSECGQRLNWVDENDHYCCRCGSRNDEGL